MKRLLFIAILCSTQIVVAQQHLLRIPDTLSGTSFNLDVHKDSFQFFPGVITQTFGINGSHYLGPTLIMRKGDSVNITVHNHIGDTTTMHWHGLHVAPGNDGGPYSMIMDGMDWNPGFVVRNSAATYWYHPHMMAKTAEQAIKGDVGFIIIRDAEEATLNLPRRYGIDDIPVVVQSVELDSINQFMPRGMVDSVVLVNGSDSVYANLPAQVVRLRLLNGSGERTMNFGFSGNKVFYVIANDNGLLPNAVQTTRIRLSPGERAEVLLDLSGMNGQSIYLMSYASELPMGVQGGPTMPMPPGSPLMNSPLNGIDFNIMRIDIGMATANPVTSISDNLIADTRYDTSLVNATRTIRMTADSIMVMDGPFYFNDSLFNMDRIDYHIPLNNVEIWKLSNWTMVAHPFHMHDVHFYILDRNGVAPQAIEGGKKDVVLVQPNETVRLIMKFNDFADTTVPYMYHCHILMHEDDGMMGQFVVGNYLNAVSNINKDGGNLFIYPNPARKSIKVKLKNGQAKLMVYSMLGQLMYADEINGQTEINLMNWPKGVYHLRTTNNDGQSVSFVVE